ncbi:MAG TPA: trehalose-phosphatase [Methylomirabilota bacterium]|nr:trehalose-phosphatase [Methylomirabilota bacterium]
MANDLQRILGWLTDWIIGGGGLLLMTDYDGTLTPIVSDPDDAALDPEVRAHLGRLVRSAQVRVAIISGRDLADVRRRVGLSDVVYAGCHGLEIEGPDFSFSHPEAEAQEELVRTVAESLSQRAPSVEGMRVEPKRLAVAVHYRDVAAEEMRRVEIELARAIRRPGSRLKIFHGTKVIEILPQVGWNKGHCALWVRDRLMRELASPTMVFYMGDDWTDELTFDALSGQAITVRVGPGDVPSKADYRLESVAEAQALLAALSDTVSMRSGR